MGRGLSYLQKRILVEGLRVRKTRESDTWISRPDLLAALFGWKQEKRRGYFQRAVQRKARRYGYWTKPAWTPKVAIDPKEYNRKQAALTRSMQRLIDRGLLRRNGRFSVDYTEEGLKLAQQMANG